MFKLNLLKNYKWYKDPQYINFLAKVVDNKNLEGQGRGVVFEKIEKTADRRSRVRLFMSGSVYFKH